MDPYKMSKIGLLEEFRGFFGYFCMDCTENKTCLSSNKNVLRQFQAMNYCPEDHVRPIMYGPEDHTKPVFYGPADHTRPVLYTPENHAKYFKNILRLVKTTQGPAQDRV
jgi:hypothetical protein